MGASLAPPLWPMPYEKNVLLLLRLPFSLLPSWVPSPCSLSHLIVLMLVSGSLSGRSSRKANLHLHRDNRRSITLSLCPV